MTPHPSVARRLSDESLASRLNLLAEREREALVWGLAHLAAMDERRLYAELGYPSLFAYCTRALGLSEDAAHARVATARAAARLPVLLDEIFTGRLSLSAAAALAPRLTPENHQALLEEARGMSRKDARFLAASLAPKSARRDRQTIEPVSGERARVHFDAGREVLDKIERARELLRHKHPEGRLEDVVSDALEALLKEKDPDYKPAAAKPAEEEKPGARSRYIPLWVRQAVWRRDRGRCAYEAKDGKLCGERGQLEYDHVIPWALGGPSNHPDNIRLLCRAHNQLQSLKMFSAGEPP